MKPNTNDEVYKIIDTTKLYELVSSIYIPDSTFNENLNKIFLKFYSNGKVGTFYSYDKNDINSLNPERADLGIYNYSNGTLTIQTYFYHVQGGGFTKNVLNKSTSCSLVFEYDKVRNTHIGIKIHKELLIYKPDW